MGYVDSSPRPARRPAARGLLVKTALPAAAIVFALCLLGASSLPASMRSATWGGQAQGGAVGRCNLPLKLVAYSPSAWEHEW